MGSGSWVKTNAMKTKVRTAVTFMTTSESPRYLAIEGENFSNEQAANKEKSKEEKDPSYIIFLR
jgi:hypothetical protein